MRKFLAAGMAALTVAGTVAATAVPTAAEAAPHHRGGYGYDHYRGHRGNDAASAAIIAGVAGLALGAALSNNHSSYGYYDRGGYGRGYYGDYYSRPRICTTERWVWDPYIGRRVPIRERYYC
jgi:hypothetical protein